MSKVILNIDVSHSKRVFLALLLVSTVLSGCASDKANTSSTPAPEKKSPDARKSFEEGIRYQRAGRTELSRQALKAAIESDPHGAIGAHARLFMQAKLPVQPISTEAEQRNVIGYNQMNHGDLKAARATFDQLIKDFPEFEWPYGTLAYICIQEKDYKAAADLLNQALAINPNYLNAWYYFSELYRQTGDTAAQTKCMAKIQEIRTGMTLDPTASEKAD